MVLMRRFALLALMLTVTGACLAQGGPPGRGGGPGGRGGFNRGGGPMFSVLEDIGILSIFDTLQLTDAQLDAILDAYTKYPLSNDPRVAKLLEIRGRVVAGTPMTAADQQAIGEMFRPQGNQPNQDQAEAPNPLVEVIWKQLTQAQQAALVAAAANRFGMGGRGGWDRNRTLDLLTHLNQAMETYEEAAWPAKKEALAEAMASTTPEAQRANAKAMYADFLERMWQMPAADFEPKKNELATTLEALIPPGGSLAPALALIDPSLVGRAMDQTFLNAKGPGLLKELKANRTVKPAG